MHQNISDSWITIKSYGFISIKIIDHKIYTEQFEHIKCNLINLLNFYDNFVYECADIVLIDELITNERDKK